MDGDLLANLKRRGYSALAAITILATSLTSCNSIKSNPNEVEKERIGTPTFTYVPTDTETPLPPTDTFTPEPTDTSTPEPTPTEEKSLVMDNLEEKVSVVRADRAQNDPDYLKRINPDLAEKYVVNILFVGRKKGGGPADIYKILSVERTAETDITTTARDLFVPELNRRINSYYTYPISNTWQKDNIQPVLIPILENITGIPIDYYVFLNSEDLVVDMIDVLGTIDVEIKRNCGIYTKNKSPMEMTGAMAANYFVQRYCDTDFHRGDRQTQVIEAILREVKEQIKTDTLTGLNNIRKMYNLVRNYEEEGRLVFNTSSPNIDEDLEDMYNLVFSFFGDAVLGRAPLPSLGEQVNFGTAGLFYSPFSGDRRYYLSPINNVIGDLPKYSAAKMREVYYKRLRNYTAEILLGN